ncbi:MAG: hypothetical protein RLZZ344_628 [Pseudomonadota bacterium]
MLHRHGRVGRWATVDKHRVGRVWLIDLDNTLHDASWRLMGEINRRMTDFVAERLSVSRAEASLVRTAYWHRYGATLLGLIRHHGVDASEFLAKTHPAEDLPDFVAPAVGLRRKLQLLRGERWLVTNAPRDYTERLLEILGIAHCFHRQICIDDMHAVSRLRPKPSPILWHRLIRASGRPASDLCLIDDSAMNLRTAHKAGIRTVRIWASPSQRRAAWVQGRPVSAIRPLYVRYQVNSWPSLIRQVGNRPPGRP